MAEAPAAETERLYSLALDEFTAERDALAKRLRREGDREAADAVKALRKPSVAAWAVNQVRRDRPDEVRRLLEVNEELHRVYAGIASAGARERLEEAASMQRDLIRSLVRCAKQLLDAGGHGSTQATLDRVADTLRAAALDEGLRERIAAGRVVKEERAAGLGPLASMPAPPPAKKGGGKAKRKAKEPAGPDPKEVRRAERAVETAERRLVKAREDLEAREDELRAAEQRLRDLR